MRAIVLRLDAPMMSFGGVIVDQHGFVERFPGRSLLTGLIGNALGWSHADFKQLERLQSRIDYAARWDVLPGRVVDYHTVDMGQTKMRGAGWTTQGEVEHRDGARDTKFGIHQRYRHYWMDGLMTVTLTLRDAENPDLDGVKRALAKPARPLFLGRKTCLPSRPLLDPETPFIEAKDLLDALHAVSRWDRYGKPVEKAGECQACWPAELGTERAEIRRVFDLRDWANQIPAGSRYRAEGLIGERSYD